MSNSQNLSKKSHGIDNDYYNYKYTSQDNRVTTQQKGDFQNDINQRLNMVNDDSIQNRRKLPFNNNIRDSQITIDNKRDSFNDRISNYSLLSNNMIAPVERQITNNQIGFHSKFNDDTNKRLDDLSSLSRNMGFNVNKEVPNKKKVMENIQSREGYIESFSNELGNYQYLDNME